MANPYRLLRSLLFQIKKENYNKMTEQWNFSLIKFKCKITDVFTDSKLFFQINMWAKAIEIITDSRKWIEVSIVRCVIL